MNDSLRKLLLEMAESDRTLRDELARDGTLFEGYHPRMQAIHEQNASQLQSVIEKHGWPGKSLVGEEASEAAWLIAQHAIALPSFQRSCLTLLQEAASRGDVPPWQPAYLLDRIRFFEGKPQIYGTQFEPDEHGVPRPYPIENPALVNELRRQIGLDSIEERQQKLAEANRENPPRIADRTESQRKYQAWLHKVGWRP